MDGHLIKTAPRLKLPSTSDNDPKFVILRRSGWVTACGAISAGLLLASLTQDCFLIDKTDNPRAWSNGLGLLLVGWLGILTGIYAWLANPFLLVAWLAMWFPNCRLIAISAGILALLLMLSFLLHDDMMSDEAGNRSRITAYGRGYWLWIATAVMTILGGCFQWKPANGTRSLNCGEH